MDATESNAHSFIVKVWLEETAEEAGKATWRGCVTHVPGGERHYLQDLERIPAIIAPYLEQMGVRLGVSWRMRRWLNRSKPSESQEH